MRNVFYAETLVHNYGPANVFALPELVIPEGSRFLITGENGSGKTTLAEILVGLQRPTQGALHLFDQPVTPPFPGWARQHLAYIAQQPYPLPGSALANILFAMSGSGLSRAARLQKARGWLDRLGLANQAEQSARRLSVGQLRRVALARALVREASVWVLDEPFAFGDDAYRQALNELLEEHTRRSGTLIMTSPPSDRARGWPTDHLELPKRAPLRR